MSRSPQSSVRRHRHVASRGGVAARGGRWGLALVALLALAGVAAAGRAPEVQSGQWAGAFCRSFGKYEHAVSQLGIQLSDSLQTSPDAAIPQRKAALSTYLAGVVVQTNRFAQSLADDGVPDIPHGGEFIATIESGFRQLRSSLARARVAAKHLPDHDVTAFDAAVSVLTDAIRRGSQRSEATIVQARAKYGTFQLDRAFRHTQACQTIV